jgi:menaquinone-9 beta-reductase
MATEINTQKYDCAIIGGGLSGLCLAIQLAKNGLKVVLFEKNNYPQHKVCGEYISMESWPFLKSLGVPLDDLNLPKLTQLGISSVSGFMLESKLPLGGFGISRYSLDHYLAKIALSKGVILHENCKVNDVLNLQENGSEISTSKGVFYAKIVCGSFGKYAPNFAKNDNKPASKQPNYIGVKYHIESDLADNRIELHNFKDGYCGISKVDMNRYCLCYLSKSSNLQAAGNDLKKMEETVLFQNPYLQKYFKNAKFLYDKPLIISNVYFEPKTTNQNGILLLGDAAGAITPLCGNGMSMAMRASKILANLLIAFFEGKIDENTLYEQYKMSWKQNFNTRIHAGKYLQHLFGKKNSTELALKTLSYLPNITKKVIGLTHGDEF